MTRTSEEGASPKKEIEEKNKFFNSSEVICINEGFSHIMTFISFRYYMAAARGRGRRGHWRLVSTLSCHQRNKVRKS